MVEVNNAKIFNNLLMIFVGWFLGLISALLSSVLLEKYKNRQKRKLVKNGIKSELRELALRLAALDFNETINSGETTREWAKWIRPYYSTLIESDEFDYLVERTKPRKDIKKLNDDEFFQALIIMQPNRQNAYLKITQIHTKIFLPYLSSSYSMLSLLSDNFVKNINKLQREVASINSDINQIIFYHSKTFDELSQSNREIINQNIDNISSRVIKNARAIIKLIEKINNN